MLPEELAEVLNRERFRAIITAGEVAALVTFLRNDAELVDDPETSHPSQPTPTTTISSRSLSANAPTRSSPGIAI